MKANPSYSILFVRVNSKYGQGEYELVAPSTSEQKYQSETLF